MSSVSIPAAARAIADLDAGTILATVDVAVSPERVFRALTTDEVTKWWGSDDMYRTTKWTADLRVGGAWKAEGVGQDGAPFSVEGEYVEIDPVTKIVFTWKAAWDGGQVTTVTYRLQPIESGTRITLRHEGFAGRPESARNHTSGWERVLNWLAAHTASKEDALRYFVFRLLPPRATFLSDITEDEKKVMGAHAAYWSKLLGEGKVVAFGPVGDPKGPWGLGVVGVPTEADARAIEANDPAIKSERGFRTEVLPMISAFVRPR